MTLRRASLLLLLCCTACTDDPLRAPSLQHGLACDASAIAVDDDDTPGFSTLLRFWNRGVEFFGFSITAPRLLEALYDSAGRPLALASVAEERVSEGSRVELLAMEFRDDRVAGSRLQITPDHAERFDHRELRAYRRFTGPPYMTVVVSDDSGLMRVVKRETIPLSSADEKKARLLVAQLWKLRCLKPQAKE